jgi:DegV family protein with EDD domain
MEKIKIVTDTASDITLEQAQELDIELLSFMLSADGNSYRELVDLSIDEFYALLEKSDELPTTSQITAFAFEEMFEKYYGQGYTDVIYVSINAKGSATYQNACMAKK